MGRVKLKIKKLENNNGRQATYAKRKHGIMKKANELSILCDIDIIVIMFSPSGKPLLYKGKNSSIEGVIEKFAQLTPQERAKRKLESLQALKKTFKKLGHDVNIQDFIGSSYQSAENLSDQASFFRTQLSYLQKRLSYWNNLDKIESIEKLGQMEESLRESLNQIRKHKENFGKQPNLELGCTNQLQNGMYLPFNLDYKPQHQPISWIPNDGSPQIDLSEDPNLFAKSDMEYTLCSSHGSYASYLGKSENTDIASTGHENGIPDVSSKTEDVQIGLYAPYPYYPPYNLGFLSEKKVQPAQPMNLQENAKEYCFDEIFEPPHQFGYDTTYRNWASMYGSYDAIPFDERLYSQQHLMSDDHMAKELGHIHVQATHQPSLTN